MLILQDLAYTHPDKELLFQHCNLTVSPHEKIALVGNNGTGKSTLLKIIAGIAAPSEGRLQSDTVPYYVPQVVDQFNHLTIAEALRAAEKLDALQEILRGNVTESNMGTLDDDWGIEERCKEALQYWNMDATDLTRRLDTLSGGQKTKVFLAGIMVHQPELILLDEPSNHLDTAGRALLYDYISSASNSFIIVSHDRQLLQLPDTICELTPQGLTVYGGNYAFYTAQKELERNSLHQELRNKEKEFRKTKEKERETMERQQKLDARGKRKQEKEGLPTISMNTFKNNAEKSTARLHALHTEKTGGVARELQELRAALPAMDKMKFGFDNAALHKGKILFDAKGINYRYNDQLLWPQDLNFRITSGERIAIKGLNGSGKTTLIKILSGKSEPNRGTIYRADSRSVYIDQDYSLINNQLSVYEQAMQFNNSGLQEHELKIRLSRFLFTKKDWDKPCMALSGGEKMRLMLCCLTIHNLSPDIIFLDEPTNNLDMQNIEILTMAINQYKGTLIVVSHDEYFLEQVRVTRAISIGC